MKKVLLLVIDALSARLVQKVIDDRLPTMRQLIDRGTVRWNCTSVFPSITPAATSSIITGAYPSRHGVMGAHFYDSADDRVYYFGGDMRVIMARGVPTFVDDFLLRLNHSVLRSETLFEAVEDRGMTAANLNYLIYRGKTVHPLVLPFPFSWWPGVEARPEVRGPKILHLGDFLSRKSQSVQPLTAEGGMSNRLGFDDDNTAECLRQLMAAGMPELTVAYFPNNDYDSHELGPEAALDTVEALDKNLGSIFEQQGGLDRVLEDLVIVVTGDHSQCPMADTASERAVDLRDVLSDQDLVPAGDPWTDDQQLMACPNLRACQVYLRGAHWQNRQELIDQALGESRIDQAIWREPAPDQRSIHVATADRGRLRFWLLDQSTPLSNSGSVTTSGQGVHDDEYGNRWGWQGDLRVVDSHVDQRGVFVFKDYPNALERLANAFDDRVSGDLWLTLHPGHEFSMPRSSVHEGGSHGSLHALDSLSPIIAAGLDEQTYLPDRPRLIDIKPLCLGELTRRD